MNKPIIRVLLVEDDEDDFILTRELLGAIKTFSCELHWAASYSAGKAAIAEKAFDVCLIDYHLGEHTGLELVREAIAEGFDAPMILLTGQDDHDIDLEAMNAGVADYLIKGKAEVSLLERAIRYALEHKRAEKVLAEVVKRERAMIENSLDIICSKDAEGKFVSVSPACVKIWGYRPEELIGRRYIELVAPEDIAKTNEVALSIMSGIEITDFENRYFHKNGSLVDVRWTAYWSDAEQLMFCVAHDITVRKQADERQQRYTQQAALRAEIGLILINKHQPLHELMQSCVAAITQHLGLAFRCIWTLNNKEQTLEIQAIAGISDHLEGVEAQVRFGQSKIGLVAEERRAHLTNDAINDSYIINRDWAAKEGLTSFAGYPLIVEDQLLGVIGLYSNKPILPDIDETLLSVAMTIALGIERKHIEQTLAETAKRETAIIENSLDVICSINAEGRFVSINPACFRMWGYHPEELIGRSFIDYVVSEDVAKTIAIDASIQSGNETTDFENRYLHKNGTLVDMRWTSYWSESEQLVFAVAHDITEQKKAEELLTRERNFTTAITNNIGEGIYALDGKGCITFVNPAAEKILGWKEEELLGRNIHEVIHYQRADGTRVAVEDCLLLKVLQNGARVYLDNEAFTHKNGEIVPVSCTSVSITTNGKIVGGVFSFHDITQRKQTEMDLKRAHDGALESVRLKSEFLANMSHEIRTPMNGVIGMTELLLDTELSACQQEYAKIIETSAEVLLRIIDDILDFSKIESGHLRFEKIDFDIRGTIESTVETLAGRAQTKGMEIASLVYSDVTTALRGDPGRLRQILTNLIGNAIKFTEKGEVVVKVRKQSEEDNFVSLRFEITDTGIGISEQAQNRLFQAFVQADGSTTRKYGGTGLGLAISRQLVEMMGGEIGIISQPGKGSTFWFTARFEKQTTQNSPVQTDNDISLEGVRILIVDDNRTNRKIFQHQTLSWGMIVAEADTGAEAFEKMRAAAAQGEPFEIALLDLMMPEMDGFDLARRIKADPTLAGTHLILLPSYGKRGHGMTASEVGIAAYLQKPVRQSQLYNCLKTILTKAAVNQDNEPSNQLLTKHSLRELSLTGNNVKTDNNVTAATTKARILVAEDNAVNQEVIITQLKSLGYASHIVANGREAVEALQKSEYAVVLMDCQMPEMDGYEATAEIRRGETNGHRQIIIAITANALDRDRQKCLAAGMDDYLTKPTKIESLRQKLEHWTVSANKETDASPEIEQNISENDSRLIVDLSVLESYKDYQQPGEPDLVGRLINLFAQDTTIRLSTLKQAVADGNTALIKSEAHNTKGATGNIGALRMTNICRELEQKASITADAAVLVSRLESEFNRVVEILGSVK